MNDEKYLRFYKLNETTKLSLNTSNDYPANENHYHIICTPEPTQNILKLFMF